MTVCEEGRATGQLVKEGSDFGGSEGQERTAGGKEENEKQKNRKNRIKREKHERSSGVEYKICRQTRGGDRTEDGKEG